MQIGTCCSHRSGHDERLVASAACPSVSRAWPVANPLPLDRQDRCTSLPRDPRMLQAPRARGAAQAQLCRGADPPAVGGARTKENRGADQERGRDDGADGDGAEPGGHGGSHRRCREDADRCGESYGPGSRPSAGEFGESGYGASEALVRHLGEGWQDWHLCSASELGACLRVC